MDRLKLVEWSAEVLKAVGFAWQGTMAIVAACGLAGWVDGLPEWGHPLAIYLVVALVSGAFVGALLLAPYGGDWGRRLGVWARIFGWQAAVGSVLAFSVGLAGPYGPERTAAFGVGMTLVIPALIGSVAYLLAEVHGHHMKLRAGHQATAEREELLAELRALRGAVESFAPVAPRRRLAHLVARAVERLLE